MDNSSECDDGRLVMLSSPDVEVAVGLALDFPAAVIDPRMPRIASTQDLDQKIKAIRQAERRNSFGISPIGIKLIPKWQNLVEWCLEQPGRVVP